METKLQADSVYMIVAYGGEQIGKEGDVGKRRAGEGGRMEKLGHNNCLLRFVSAR